MWPFSSTTKMWKVGKHRLKKVRRKKTKWGGRHSYTEKVTRYKCVDCERVLDDRESFESDEYTCYDVITE